MNKNACMLYEKINEVIGRLIYQPGYPDWNGIHRLKLPKKPHAQPGITWCNAAANQIMKELGYNTKPVLLRRGIGWTNANNMHIMAVKASQDMKTGVIEIEPETAQKLANKGYAILVTAFNHQGPGHIGVVCPSDKNYNPSEGALIGQAGAVNGIRSAKKSFPGLTHPQYFILPRK